MKVIIDKVTHKYGDVIALEGLNLEVESGEIVAVIGPSGCGKSTLLSIVGGIQQPTSGQILTEGVPDKGCLNPLTFVFQDFALLPWRSVEANVSFALEDRPIDKRERAARIEDALARTGLTEFRTAFPKQLSGGMRQRVGIARALAVSPQILLMDEPLSALDAQTRELLMDDFLDLWMRQKIGAIYVTHNLTEAVRLADRIVVLSRRPGRIREIASVSVPQADRKTPAAALELAALQEQLWDLMRTEAHMADRELGNHE